MARITIKNHGELVQATMNRFGHILVEPASKRFAQSVAERSVLDPNPDTGRIDAYIQQDVDAWIKENVPPRHRRDMNNGWTVKFYLYDEAAWCLFGCAF